MKENLNQKIDREIEKEVGKEMQSIDQRIKAEIDKDIEKEIATSVAQKVKKRISSEVPPTPEIQQSIFTQIRSNLFLMWQSGGQQIFFVALIFYIPIVLLMLACLIPIGGLCLSQGLLGAGSYLAIVASVALAFMIYFSVATLKSRSALIFSLVVSIPLLILVIILLLRYIGLFLLGIGIILFLSQVIRNRR